MKIGIIGGTGPAGSGLALRLNVAGYDVVIGSRDKARSVEKVKELQSLWPSHNLSIQGGDNADAVKCDLVVVATPWDSTATIVGEFASQLAGKIVVTMANALVKVGKEFQPLFHRVEVSLPTCKPKFL
ncbi:MAG: hypothetical protein ABR75_00220 [Acidimicrobiia bacterium BACL6 MAG-120924-bin43]|uniref:Pyrroline-5-carboxylate reductase catalytic N-terminal domain-containing protein n=1 Tax=Acidimicrobiia bacterium BACL6 MAG-120924-bin43 TaxID=1655583 RepID=A0A0R2Q7W3_9ACTN|nr:MAG: hypothetical protein ABR75_00220 [Acidimicrobiia bacterium BACL6 MAG-120924-bin43]